MKRFLRFAGLLLLAVVLAGAVLFQFFGLRVVQLGSGRPTLAFVRPVAERDAALEEHRAARKTGSEVQGVSGSAAPVGSGVIEQRNGRTPEPGTSEPRNPGSDRFWTAFRGPDGSGVYTEMPVRSVWPAGGLTPMWKQPIGGGYASFAVANGRAFTIEQRRAQETVAAYDVLTGRELWTHAWSGEFKEFQGGDGPRATPAWADGVVYALGGLGELRALDEATGRQRWRVNILEDNGASNLTWGMAGSPLVVDDLVVVQPGGSSRRSVVAYDRRTGARVWSALDDKQAYAAPMLATIAGVRQVLVVTARRLVGLTPDRGELLWEYPWVTSFDVNATQPIVVGDNRVFISSGYDKGAAVVELTPAGGRLDVREVWRNNRMKNRFASSVLHEGFIYGFDESIFACIDAATGELKWKGGRYGYGQVILAGDRLIALTEDGDLVLMAANPERHEELVRFPVLEGKTWNHPALDGGILLVRNLQEMAAFDLRIR